MKKKELNRIIDFKTAELMEAKAKILQQEIKLKAYHRLAMLVKSGAMNAYHHLAEVVRMDS